MAVSFSGRYSTSKTQTTTASRKMAVAVTMKWSSWIKKNKNKTTGTSTKVRKNCSN